MATVRITIPSTIKGMIKQLNGLNVLLNAKGWERAAVVYAWTREGGVGGRPSAKPVKNDRFTPVEFAALGIHGLTSHNTVQKHRDAWANHPRTNKGLKPGDDVILPDEDYPPTDSRTGHFDERILTQVKNAKPEVRVAVTKHLLADPAVTTRALISLPIEVTGAVLDAAEEVMDTHRLPPQPTYVSMAGSSVYSDVTRHFAQAAREIEKAVRRLNEAITHGTRFESEEFELLAMQPESVLDPELTIYRKTVAMVVVHEDDRR